jgi:tetratricopeptide (TPR) repeat protein
LTASRPKAKVDAMSAPLVTAFQHHQAGRLAEAEQLYRQVLAADPGNPDALHLLGLIATSAGRLGEAVSLLSQAVERGPLEASFHFNLGCALEQQEELEKATAAFLRAVQLKPDYAEAWNNLGHVYEAQDRFEEAIDAYRRAIATRPGYVLALKKFGYLVARALSASGKPGEAAECYRKVLELDPNDVTSRSNYADVLRRLGQFTKAEAECERSLALDPHFPNALCVRGLLRLLQGRFEDGWTDYEYRWTMPGMCERKFQQPQWRGESLEGRTILLHAEQGLGDAIQFVRYAALVKAKNPDATVICEVQPRLRALLSRCFGMDLLVSAGETPPPFDVQCPLLSLPLACNTTLNSIPTTIPYVFADTALVTNWRDKLSGIPGFRIGINWQGRGGAGPWRQRDISPELFAGLSCIGISLVSLQKDAQPPSPIIDVGAFDVSDAFVDTAAIMANVDLVITSDTAAAHLAGALGVPVWVALPFVPDWRWMLDRDDSPWYPTMRLFRQNQPGDWEGVFEEIEVALRERGKG